MGEFHLFEHSSTETSNEKFILHEDNIPLHPLSARDLYDKPHPSRTTIRTDIDFSSFRVPTEAEIKDRGKSDWLAKSLVLLQTSWFVMQCIARAHAHLPVTHLENCDTCVCDHEFRDIRFLVEQASQCQPTCSSVPKI